MFVDLLDPLSFDKSFVLSKNEVVQPRWDIDILIHVTEEDNYLEISYADGKIELQWIKRM